MATKPPTGWSPLKSTSADEDLDGSLHQGPAGSEGKGP